jgi:hypothetical protein
MLNCYTTDVLKWSSRLDLHQHALLKGTAFSALLVCIPTRDGYTLICRDHGRYNVFEMAPPERVALPTPGFEDRRSILLSYGGSEIGGTRGSCNLTMRG